MPEQASADKAKRDPKKLPVRAPSPTLDVATAAPKTEMLASPTQTFSSQQLIQLQRTLGNKAVGDLLRKQKAGAAPVQREAETAAATDASPVKLHTEDNVVQQWPWSSKKKDEKPKADNPPAYQSPFAVMPDPQPLPKDESAERVKTGSAVAPTVAGPAPTGVLPAPTRADSDVKASVAQKASPVAALKTYREAVGVHLREAKRDKFKIDRYKTYLEADFVFLKSNVPVLLSEEASLKQREEMLGVSKDEKKKLAVQRKKLNEKKAKIGESDLKAAETKASVRIKKAYDAKGVADVELPVIEYAYDELVKMRHDDLQGVKHGLLFGSGDHRARRDHYQKKLDMAILIGNSPNPHVPTKDKNTNLRDIPKYEALVKKHQKRMNFVLKAEKDLEKAQTLRGQAKLSESYMGFKRKELKTAKGEVKETKRNVQLGSHIASKAESAILGFGLSTLTLGMVEIEQNKVDGGYSSKREYVTIVDSWKRDWAALKAVWKSQAYGKMTGLHLFFQGLGSLILKPLRKIFTAAALIFTGLSLIPGLAVVTGPLAAFCTLVTLGLVAAKMAVDTMLTTWSALTLALNKNAHNTDVLRGQTRGQATDVVAGAVAMGAAFAAPAIGNAAGGNYLNPLQNPQGGGSIMDYKPGSAGGPQGMFNGDMYVHQLGVQGAKLPATIGMTVAEKGVGALGELEGMGLGAQALFKTRQEQIMKSGMSPAENYEEVLKAKLDALIYDKIDLETALAKNQSKPDKVKAVKAKLELNKMNTEQVKVQILLARRTGSQTGAMAASAKAAPQVDQAALAHIQRDIDPEVEKERAIRQASTGALASKAKSQVAALVSGLGESQVQGTTLADGAKTVEKGVMAATPSQGVQPVDAPNASAAQSNISEAKEIIEQIVEVANAAPAAVDEAMASKTDA